MDTKNVTVDKIGIWQLAFEIFSGQREPIVAKAGEVSGGNEKRLTSGGPEAGVFADTFMAVDEVERRIDMKCGLQSGNFDQAARK